MTLSLSITLLFILNDISCVFLSTNKPKHPDKIKQISKSAEGIAFINALKSRIIVVLLHILYNLLKSYYFSAYRAS